MNQKGFGIIGILLVIVVVGLVGGTGWYLYSSNKKTNNAPNTNVQNETPQQVSEPEETIDEEAQSWQLVTSAQDGFSIRIPDGWKVTNYGQSDNIKGNRDIIYKPGTKAIIENTAEAYHGDGLVRFSIIQFKDTDDFRYVHGDETKTPFKAGNLEGIRYYKKFPIEPIQGMGPLPGEDQYIYEFKTPGKVTYVVYHILNKNQYTEEYLQRNYGQDTSDPNQLEIVERAVKTLTIN